MTVGVSIIERYRVCRIERKPTYEASLIIRDNFDNVTHSVHLEPTVTTFSDPSGDFTMTIDLISLNADQLTDFVVTDLHDGTSYFLHSDLVNGLNEFSPGKLGFCKRVGNVVTCSPDMADRTAVTVISCTQDKFNINYQYPTFAQVLLGAEAIGHSTTGMDTDMQGLGPVPPLQRGAIFGTPLGMSWIGLTTQGYISIGPYSYTVPYSQVTSWSGTPVTFSGSVHPTPRNSSCIYVMMSVQDSGGDEDPIGYISCPYWPHGNYILGSLGQGGQAFYTGANDQLTLRYYPLMQLTGRTWATIASTVIVSSDQRAEIAAMTSLQTPVTIGSTALVSIAYKDYTIEFDSTTIVPRITDLKTHDKEIVVTVRSDQSTGNCFISTEPFITATTPVFLTTSELAVTLGLLSVNYTGDATLTVACGVRHTNRTFHVEISEGIYDFSQHTIVQSLNPFHHDGFFGEAGIFHILIRVGIYASIAAGSVIVIYLAYKFLWIRWMARPKKIPVRAPSKQKYY